MSRQVLVISTFVCAVGLCAAASKVAGQQQAIEPEGLKVFNRSVSSFSDGARKGVRLSEHAVQYIAQPIYPWQKLRAEQPGKYERAIDPVPDPNAWFHVRVVVASPKVSVFVDDAKQPSLVVDQLSNRKKGLVGLWVGNTSGGDFANVKIVPR